MKKFKKMAYIVLIIAVVVLSLTIYTNASKNDKENQKEKILAEIKFVEVKLINIFNSMNNIKINDYNIATIEISKESNTESETEKGEESTQGGQGNQGSQSGQESGQSSEESSSSQGGQSGGNSSSQGGESSGKTSGGEGSQEESKKNQKNFELESNEILISEGEQINWDNIKIEIENLYDDLPSITMDLYQISNMNQEDILNFNKEYDNLTTVVKKEDKQATLQQVSKVYDFLPKFLRNLGQDELYTISVETKANIFKAYSKLDDDNWEEISNDVKQGIDSYSKLLTNTNIQKQKQSNISKGYIMINELQNAVNMKDKEVFLIKYKNLLEEINVI